MATRTGTDAPAVTGDYRRIAATFGLVTAVLILLLIVLTFAGGTPPAIDSPSQEVLRYYQDNEGLAKIGSIIGFLILVTAPLFFLGVYSMLRGRGSANEETWPRVSLTAFIVTGAVVGTQGAVGLALALGAKDEFDGAPAVAGGLFDLYNGLGAVIGVVFGLYLIATAVSLQRAGGYPAWWSTLLYVAGAASFLSFLTPYTEVEALALIGIIPILLFGIWAAAAGMAMNRPGATTTTTTATRA